MTPAGARLRGEHLVRRYGGLAAVAQVDIRAEPGEITALIGPNGAGKTTLFACLTGVEVPDEGRVYLDDADVTTLSADARARLGMARTFQRLAVFASMTVTDNLLVGAEGRRTGSLVRGLLGLPEPAREANQRQVDAVLHLLGLEQLSQTRAGALPTGTLRLVELGRAMCQQPKVLLLDEPASGLDSQETAALQTVLRGIAAQGVAVLIVEHDVDLVFHVADVIYAMAEGRVIRRGTPEEVRADPLVLATYLDPVGTR